MKQTNRFIALLLTLAMVCTLLPTAAFAIDEAPVDTDPVVTENVDEAEPTSEPVVTENVDEAEPTTDAVAAENENQTNDSNRSPQLFDEKQDLSEVSSVLQYRFEGPDLSQTVYYSDSYKFKWTGKSFQIIP